jgi:hypothetical protein
MTRNGPRECPLSDEDPGLHFHAFWIEHRSMPDCSEIFPVNFAVNYGLMMHTVSGVINDRHQNATNVTSVRDLPGPH